VTATGYWAVHPYERRSVDQDVEEFVGWNTLLEMVEEAGRTRYRPSPVWPAEAAEDYQARLRRRDQALIATLFETGGRATEAVELEVSNFRVGSRFIVVRGMRVLKRYRKVAKYKDSQGRTRYKTEPVFETRGRFSFPRDEPLVPYLLSWIEEVGKGPLFPSPAKTRSHLSRVRAYQIVTDIGRRVGVEIWPHWFRAQRASQLSEEYGFDIHRLMEWFSWKRVETALKYAKLSTRAYEEVFNQAQAQDLEARLRALEAENRRLRAALQAAQA